MILIEKIYSYSWSYDAHYRFFCVHNSCHQLMGYDGVENRGLYLNCVWDCSVDYDTSRPYGFSISSDSTPLLDDCSPWYQFTFHDDYEKAWQENCRILNTGRPVIIALDRYYLPYAADFSRRHGAHAALLFGYAENTKKAFIVDWYPDEFYIGPVCYIDLRKARLSDNAWNGNINSGRELKCASLVLSEGIPSGGYKQVISTIDAIHNQYFSCEQPCHGQGALQNLLKTILDNSQNPPRVSLFSYLYRQLFPQVQKKILLDYYLEQASVFNKDMFQSARRYLHTIIYEWENILQNLMRLAYSEKQNKKTLQDELRYSLQSVFSQELTLGIGLDELAAKLRKKGGFL